VGTTPPITSCVGRGAALLCVVKCGTLRAGQSFVCGRAHGRIKAIRQCHANMRDEIEMATPGMMVELMLSNQGLNMGKAPPLGETFHVMAPDAVAHLFEQREMVEEFKTSLIDGPPVEADCENEFQAPFEQQPMSYLVVKADSAAAMLTAAEMVEELNKQELAIEVVHWGIGDVTENDIEMASVSQSTVISYNVKCAKLLSTKAAQRGVKVVQGGVLHEIIAEVAQRATDIEEGPAQRGA